MNELDSLQQWVLAVGALAIAVAATATVRASLRKLGSSRGWPLLSELAPAISSFVYIIGLYLFAEIAPLAPTLQGWIDSGTYVLAVVIGFAIVRRAAVVAIEWSALRSSSSSALQQGFIPFLRNLITLFIFISGAIMILKRFNYDVMSLVTALGVGSLAVGLAAKETLSNMISGFILIIDRNLRPGDRITLAGTIGDIQEIGLRSTRVKTGDGNVLVVPNSELVNTKVLNQSLAGRAKSCSTSFAVAYAVSFEKVREICLEIIVQVAKCDQSRGKWVNLDKLTDGYQTITAGFWLKDMDDQGAALTEFHQRLLERFARDQIALHVPASAPAAAGNKN